MNTTEGNKVVKNNTQKPINTKKNSNKVNRRLPTKNTIEQKNKKTISTHHNKISKSEGSAQLDKISELVNKNTTPKKKVYNSAERDFLNKPENKKLLKEMEEREELINIYENNIVINSINKNLEIFHNIIIGTFTGVILTSTFNSLRISSGLLGFVLITITTIEPLYLILIYNLNNAEQKPLIEKDRE